MNLMKMDGYHAKIEFDEESDQFRGEILGLSGGADFYGSSPDELRREFSKSLDIFLDVCKEQGSSPVEALQENSIFGFRLNYTKNWR
jgi:predicted HicB family RNase H-like nuclease